MREPATALTDYLLAIAATFVLLRLWRLTHEKRLLGARLFFIGFAAAAIGGGTWHGFFSDPASASPGALWWLTLVCGGVTASGLAVVGLECLGHRNRRVLLGGSRPSDAPPPAVRGLPGSAYAIAAVGQDAAVGPLRVYAGWQPVEQAALGDPAMTWHGRSRWPVVESAIGRTAATMWIQIVDQERSTDAKKARIAAHPSAFRPRSVHPGSRRGCAP